VSLKSYLNAVKSDGKIPVIAVVGPTASGKSDLAVEICKNYGGEVVSADSMQIYRDIGISTAKPTKEEMQGIRHHLIDIIELNEPFNVYEYCKLAKEALLDISNRNLLPVLAGGTGLYIDSLLKGVSFSDSDANQNIREEIIKKANEKGYESLLEELRQIDLGVAEKLNVNDKNRIVRALERFYATGKTPTQLNEESIKISSVFKPIYIGLNFADRFLLYDRINYRVDEMVKRGILDEAMHFYKAEKSSTSIQAIGLKEFFSYFDRESTLEESIEKLKQSTRRYAKRQLTWFRRNSEIKWFNIDEYPNRTSLYDSIFLYLNDKFSEPNI